LDPRGDVGGSGHQLYFRGTASGAGCSRPIASKYGPMWTMNSSRSSSVGLDLRPYSMYFHCLVPDDVPNMSRASPYHLGIRSVAARRPSSVSEISRTGWDPMRQSPHSS